MKRITFSVLLFVFLFPGCAHSPYPASSLEPPPASPRYEEVAVASSPGRIPLNPASAPAISGSENLDDKKDVVKEATATISDPVVPAEMSVTSVEESVEDQANLDYVEEGGEEVKAGIADPLEPFNRAMYHVNDKLYFWVLKPLAQGYRTIVPEVARVSVGNFFSNITFPVRFVNCLLQANFRGAARELGRFVINTLWGIGGLLDLASREDINLPKQDEDFGQTLGVYGVGQGFYINWPIWGPSSPRDTLGTVGDFFLHPFAYYPDPWVVSTGLRGYEKVNDTSLRIGDYESLKEAAIDPYIAIRDAYVQYRLNKVKEKGGNPSPAKSVEKPSHPR
jgi:phospholipid-binding lipoprotein MlaA